MTMTTKEKQPIYSITSASQEITECSHQLHRINAQLDILWRAAWYDQTEGGYPELIVQIRKQVSEVADRIIGIAWELEPQPRESDAH